METCSLNLPLISVVIPHYGGEKIILECISSLQNTNYPKLEIIIIDNNSPDKSIQMIKSKFIDINIIYSQYNRGFAGGCNLGASHASGKYLLILNNDTIHESEWIMHLVTRMESNTSISSIQPKIKNYKNKDYFDYAGACGGFMDKYCFPFARGRIFNTIEKDEGQYDNASKIFWASGTAFLTKRKIFNEIGGFDENLFAHMEEIDYHWKCQLLGYEVWVEPLSLIYHHGAITLPKSSAKKTYLNYRNSLILLLTNYPFSISLKLFFPRIVIELISLINELFHLRWGHALAIIKAWIWILLHPTILYYRRKKLVINHPINNIYNRSIVLEYYLRGYKKFIDIIHYDEKIK